MHEVLILSQKRPMCNASHCTSYHAISITLARSDGTIDDVALPPLATYSCSYKLATAVAVTCVHVMHSCAVLISPVLVMPVHLAKLISAKVQIPEKLKIKLVGS